jgi:hypothetical protein
VNDSPVSFQPLCHSSPSTDASSGSASTTCSVPSVATTYVTSGLAATATLETSVHGVVVQTSSDARPASGPETSGKRTYTDGSTTVS